MFWDLTDLTRNTGPFLPAVLYIYIVGLAHGAPSHRDRVTRDSDPRRAKRARRAEPRRERAMFWLGAPRLMAAMSGSAPKPSQAGRKPYLFTNSWVGRRTLANPSLRRVALSIVWRNGPSGALLLGFPRGLSEYSPRVQVRSAALRTKDQVLGSQTVLCLQTCASRASTQRNTRPGNHVWVPS